MEKRRLGLLLFCGLLSACASSPTKKNQDTVVVVSPTSTPTPEAETYGPSVPLPDPFPIPDSVPLFTPGPLTIVVGPGLARASFFTGFMRVLEEEKIPVQRLVGVEGGALIAGVYALSESQGKVDWLVQKFSKDDFTGSGSSLQKKLDSAFGKKDLSQARIPLLLLAYCNGQTKKMEKGNAPGSLRAAVSNSEVLDPVEWDGLRCVSHEKETPFPIEIAREYTKNPIVVIDLLEGISTEPSRLDAYFAKVRANGAKERDSAELVIHPVLRTDFLDFSKPGEAVYLGKKTARSYLADLKRLTTPPPPEGSAQ